MKIKLDENLPPRLAILLKDLGHDTHTLQDELLLGHSGREIWEAAQKESRFLITQDSDFSDLRQFSRSYNQAAQVPSSKVTSTSPRSPSTNSRIMLAFVSITHSITTLPAAFLTAIEMLSL